MPDMTDHARSHQNVPLPVGCWRVIEKLRELRILLTELGQEKIRFKEAMDARWDEQKRIKDAFRAAPGAETGKAYFDWLDWANSSKDYEWQEQLHQRKRKVIDEMNALFFRLHDLLEVRLTPEDWG